MKRSPYYVWITPTQLVAYRALRTRWHGVISRLHNYRLCPPAATDYIGCLGVWVGDATADRPGRTYIGIEPDGYTHS